MPVLAFHPLFTARRARGPVAVAPSAVVLVVPDRPRAPGAAVGKPGPTLMRRAAEAAKAEGGAVTVVATVRIHGSALGAPHPGLLPTPREREQGQLVVAETVRALEKLGVSANGHIIVTRNPGRAIAGAVRAHRAGTVLLGPPDAHGLRRLIEGDLAAQLRRRLRASAAVVTVEAAAVRPG